MPLVKVLVAQPVRVVRPVVASGGVVEDLEDFALGERRSDLHRGLADGRVVRCRDLRRTEGDGRHHPRRVDHRDRGIEACPRHRHAVQRVPGGVDHGCGERSGHPDRVEGSASWARRRPACRSGRSPGRSRRAGGRGPEPSECRPRRPPASARPEGRPRVRQGPARAAIGGYRWGGGGGCERGSVAGVGADWGFMVPWRDYGDF